METVNPTSWNDCGMDWSSPETIDAHNPAYIMAINKAIAERLSVVSPTRRATWINLSIQPYELYRTGWASMARNHLFFLLRNFVRYGKKSQQVIVYTDLGHEWVTFNEGEEDEEKVWYWLGYTTEVVTTDVYDYYPILDLLQYDPQLRWLSLADGVLIDDYFNPVGLFLYAMKHFLDMCTITDSVLGFFRYDYIKFPSDLSAVEESPYPSPASWGEYWTRMMAAGVLMRDVRGIPSGQINTVTRFGGYGVPRNIRLVTPEQSPACALIARGKRIGYYLKPYKPIPPMQDTYSDFAATGVVLDEWGVLADIPAGGIEHLISSTSVSTPDLDTRAFEDVRYEMDQLSYSWGMDVVADYGVTGGFSFYTTGED